MKKRLRVSLLAVLLCILIVTNVGVSVLLGLAAGDGSATFYTETLLDGCDTADGTKQSSMYGGVVVQPGDVVSGTGAYVTDVSSTGDPDLNANLGIDRKSTRLNSSH